MALAADTEAATANGKLIVASPYFVSDFIASYTNLKANWTPPFRNITSKKCDESRQDAVNIKMSWITNTLG